MKKIITFILAFAMIFSVAACSNESATVPTSEPSVEPTAEPLADWEYDPASKTLYVNADMGAFEPNAPDFEGTTSNAPWSEYLSEIEKIVVGDDVTFIGDYALAFCTNLKNVEVGKNVSALDFRCFFKCGDFDNDSSIDFHFSSTPSYGEDVFGYTWDNPNVTIYVPDDMKEYWANYIMQKGEMRLDGYEMNTSTNVDDILYTMLWNPQWLWGEGSNGFAENDGGEYGGGVKKGYNADMQRLEIFGESTGACAKFNTSLQTCMSDSGMSKVPQQAVIIKFSASDISQGARVSFDALDEIDFWFRDDGVYFVDVARYLEMPISDYMPNNLELKDDTIYYFFFAFDEEGDIHMFIWEDGNIENQAYFEYDLYQKQSDINSSDLILHLGIGANAQFNLYEYWIYTFESFMDGSPFIMTGGSQSDGDYGPQWSINICGNFDIMSDLVWRDVEGRELEVNGDIYVGYKLADLMNFSGNPYDTAMVIFDDSNADSIQVSPTSEAYIVFKKNGEFLGGPFLLFNNELIEYPVIQIQEN